MKRLKQAAHLMVGLFRRGGGEIAVTNTGVDVSDLQRVARQTHVILEIDNGFLLVNTSTEDYTDKHVTQYCKDLEAVYETMVTNKAKAALGLTGGKPVMAQMSAGTGIYGANISSQFPNLAANSTQTP